jgi:hypothetical protein
MLVAWRRLSAGRSRHGGHIELAARDSISFAAIVLRQMLPTLGPSCAGSPLAVAGRGMVRCASGTETCSASCDPVAAHVAHA